MRPLVRAIMCASLTLALGCAAEEPPQPPSLALDELPGTGWRLVSLVDEDGTMEALGVAEITLAFNYQGGFVGSGGCNRFFGGVEISDQGALSIGPVGSTQMACDAGIMSREYRFLRALESCDAALGTVARLELEASNGGARLIFDAAPGVAAGGS